MRLLVTRLGFHIIQYLLEDVLRIGMRSVSLEFLDLQEAAFVGFLAESQLSIRFEDENVGWAGQGHDAHSLACGNVLKLEKAEVVN